MIHRALRVLILLGTIVGMSTLLSVASEQSQDRTSQDHLAWAHDVLLRMQTIKPGMTRADLLKVFRTEGGLSTALQRRYVSRDCAYFKVDVEFEATARPNRDREGRVTL